MASSTLQNGSRLESSPSVVQSHLINKWFIPATILLLLIFSLELFLSVRTESETFDEPAHLYSGYSYWLRSDFGVNPEHPPLVKLVASLPLLVDQPKYPEPVDVYFRAVSGIGGVQLLSPPGSETLLAHARTAVSAFALLLAVLVTLAACEMFGKGTAIFALALLVFDPLILGHGALVTTDIGAACFIFATVYAFYRYVKRPSFARLVLCCVAAGLSLAAKHSAVFVFPILLLLAVIEVAFLWRLPDQDVNGAANRQSRGRAMLWSAASLLVIGVASVAILWSAYGFRYQARPNGRIIIPPTAAFLKELHHPAEAQLIGFSERHHLLPEAYLYGLTDVATLCRDGRVMYLMGQIYPEGRWFYFPAAFLIKCTLGFLVLLALLPSARAVWRKERLREVLFLAVPALAFFLWAMTSKLDIGIRHILPVFPFLIVLVAAGALALARQSRAWVWAVGLLLLLHVGSSMRAFPDYLPYSNELFGGPEKTHWVLADSNVGWGGGLKALSAYLRDNHIRDCWLAYSAFPDPASFGIPCKVLPTFFSMIADQGQQQPVPEQIHGPVFMSSVETAGYWGADDMDPYQQFASMRPAHVIAGEILEYDGTFSIPRIAAVSHYEVVRSILGQHGKAADAVAHARAAVALDPNSLYAHQALSYAFAANGQKDEAVREYQEAVHLFETVHPEFKNDEFPPRNPLAGPGN